MHTKKTALILTLLALNSCHATLQNPENQASISPRGAFERNTTSLINGFYREASDQATQKPIESQTRTATTMPKELIDIIGRMIFGTFSYEKDDKEGIRFCLMENYQLIASTNKALFVWDTNSPSPEFEKKVMILDDPEQRCCVQSALIYDNLLFLGLHMIGGTIPCMIKVFDIQNGFSTFPTIKLEKEMVRPCAALDPLKKILFSIDQSGICLYSIANFNKETKGLELIDKIPTQERCYCIEVTDQFVITGDRHGKVILYSREKPHKFKTIAQYVGGDLFCGTSCVKKLAYSSKLNLLFCTWTDRDTVAVFKIADFDPSLVTSTGKSKMTKNEDVYEFRSSDPSSVGTRESDISNLFFDDKGGHLFVARENNTIEIYDEKLTPICTIKPFVKTSFHCFCMDPSGREIAYTSGGYSQRIERIENISLLLK